MNIKSIFILALPFVIGASLLVINNVTIAANPKAVTIAPPSALVKQYNYTAKLKAATRRTGILNIRGIKWNCQGTRCTTRGPWPQPGINSCNQLAQKVGQITVYGHPGKRLSTGQLATCNKGVNRTAISATGKIGKKPGVFQQKISTTKLKPVTTKLDTKPLKPTTGSRAVTSTDFKPLAPARPGVDIRKIQPKSLQMKPPLVTTGRKVQILNGTKIPVLNKSSKTKPLQNAIGRQYNYTAMLKAATKRKGIINFSGIKWTCRGTQCTARGPWPQPAVKSCNQLAMKVGQITGYGHPGKKLSIGQIVQCNRGVISTGINLAGKINKRSNVFGSSVTKQIKVPFEPTNPSERVPISKDHPLPESRVMSRNPVMLDNANSNSALVSISPNISTSLDVADIKISRRGVASIESIQTVNLPGSGNVEEANIRYTIEVFNDGNAAGNYKIVTIVPGSPRNHVSDTFGIVASERQTKTINIRSQYQLRSGSMRLPITIKLTNPVGRVIGQYIANADMAEAMARYNRALQQRLAPLITDDLSLEEFYPRVSVRLPPGPILRWFGDAFGAATQGFTIMAFTILNSGQERWGYPGRVRVNYQGGRGDNVYRLEGVTNGAYVDLPRGIQPNNISRISLSMAKALAPGFYYTATVRIESDSDQVAWNNVRGISFFVENNGSVTQYSEVVTQRRSSEEEAIFRMLREAGGGAEGASQP